MNFPPDGPYAIIKSPPPGSPEQYLTQEGTESRAPIFILPPSGAPGQQEVCICVAHLARYTTHPDTQWHVSRGEQAGITLRNIQSGKFIGYEGSPDVNKRLVAVDRLMEFIPMHAPGQEPNVFILGVPERNDLVVDQPLTRDFPPQVRGCNIFWNYLLLIELLGCVS
ncbi:hypothetical protein FRC12_022241 [Ceratobasidium sp. 428]|nr:hypothetical protein FRC12_022241 [Ceratobasidium sp. 428]